MEDLYKPFKQKKSTRASKAKEKGLEPLALVFWAQELESGKIEELAAPFVDEEKGVANAAEAIQGAMDIIAEMIADDPELTAIVRGRTQRAGLISSTAEDAKESTVYDLYYEFSEGISKIPDHRVLAINRGEKEKKLKVKVIAPVEDIHRDMRDFVITNEKSIFTALLNDVVEDSYKRLMAPSVEREMRKYADRTCGKRSSKSIREKYGKASYGAASQKCKNYQHRPGLPDRLQGGSAP